MTQWGQITRVASDEAFRYFRGFNKRVLAFVLGAAAVAALLLPFLLSRGIVPDEGIYRAEVTPGSPLLDPLEADRRFEVNLGVGIRFHLGQADLFVHGTEVDYEDTERGRSAARDLAEFAQRYYDRILRDDPNQTAAFPVRINLVYQARDLSAIQASQAGGRRPLGPSDAYSNPEQSLVLQQPGEALLELVPGTVEPPFPMRSLLLTFVYLIPLNFVGQYYAGSLLMERTRQRGILLLSAPLTGPEILMGKTAPYLAFAFLYSLVATLFLQAGVLAFLATIPIFCFFFAATCFAGLLARSYRELTFFVTTMSVALSTYLFLPAIFTQVHPIAFISPISVVAAGIRNEPVPFLSFLYSVAPLFSAAVVLAILSFVLYREETLFAPRGVGAKVLDAVHLSLPRPRRFLWAGMLVLPFVFGAELFVLAFAVSLPLRLALPSFLVGVAIVEELAKALPVFAHYRRARGRFAPARLGFLMGTGFFLGEKLALLFSLVGIGLLPLGRTLLDSYGVTTSLFLVMAPWALHVATSLLTAYAARWGTTTFLVGLPLAAFVHVVYNWTVIRAAS